MLYIFSGNGTNKKVRSINFLCVSIDDESGQPYHSISPVKIETNAICSLQPG